MEIKTQFKGKFYYTYVESGFSEKDFEHVYDFNERKINCTLELPNKEGNYVILFNFITPDGKHEESIQNNLKNIIINGGEKLFFGIHFTDYKIENNKTLINGNFIIEFIKEDGFHCFGCKLEFNDKSVIKLLESNDLFYKKNN